MVFNIALCVKINQINFCHQGLKQKYLKNIILLVEDIEKTTYVRVVELMIECDGFIT